MPIKLYSSKWHLITFHFVFIHDFNGFVVSFHYCIDCMQWCMLRCVMLSHSFLNHNMFLSFFRTRSKTHKAIGGIQRTLKLNWIFWKICYLYIYWLVSECTQFHFFFSFRYDACKHAISVRTTKQNQKKEKIKLKTELTERCWKFSDLCLCCGSLFLSFFVFQFLSFAFSFCFEQWTNRCKNRFKIAFN